jgi:hypothetical protein
MATRQFDLSRKNDVRLPQQKSPNGVFHAAILATTKIIKNTHHGVRLLCCALLARSWLRGHDGSATAIDHYW